MPEVRFLPAREAGKTKSWEAMVNATRWDLCKTILCLSQDIQRINVKGGSRPRNKLCKSSLWDVGWWWWNMVYYIVF